MIKYIYISKNIKSIFVIYFVLIKKINNDYNYIIFLINIHIKKYILILMKIVLYFN